MKRVIRSLAVRLLFASGLLTLWKRVRLRRRAVVLMYHRVLSDPACASTSSHPAIVVKRRTFERHLQLLRRHFRALSLEEFEMYRRKGIGFPSCACVVTFDDGWVDTYSEAWPLLRQYDIPAVVFLPVSCIGTAWIFWQEQLHYLLKEACLRSSRDRDFAVHARSALEAYGHGSLIDFPLGDVGERVRAVVVSIKNRDRAAPRDLIERLLALLGENVAPRSPVDALMSWDMARQMAQAGIAFGAHGATHRIMTQLSGPELDDEVEKSREVMQHELGRSPESFCYPNGDWNPSVAGRVAAAGFTVAFSTKRGVVGVEDDPYALRRINIQESMACSDAMFLARVVGVI